jgi:tRNA(fMet)-specific endonuclease VapC
MGVLIDASVLIEYERQRLDLERQLEQREDEDFFLSVVTASELLHGVHRATDSAVRARRSAWVEAILKRFPLLPIGVRIARAHAQLWADLASRGQMIGPNDLWLAASCVAHGFVIVTANEREFRRVPGLEVEPWQSRI